jgi:hypothetical protein
VKIFDFPLAGIHSRPYPLRMSNTTATAAKSETETHVSYVATIRNAETTVILGPIGVSVYVRNAASKAWSGCGYGKHFQTIAEAIGSYKSAPMKAFLESIKRDQEPANVIQFA